MDRLARRKRFVRAAIRSRVAYYSGVYDEQGRIWPVALCVACNLGEAGLKRRVPPCRALWDDETARWWTLWTIEDCIETFTGRFRHISYGDLTSLNLPHGTDDGGLSASIRGVR